MAKHIRVLIVLLCVITAGCATSRSEIRLSSPPTPSKTATASRAVVIRSITDERVFEQAPKDPSVPSLGFEGASQASAALKARAIGRKRNSYGKALGDVLLQGDQTVVGVVRENLTSALSQAGYVVDETSRDRPALTLDVHIKQFWAWFKPGFFAITLNTNIATDLVISDGANPITVSVHAEDTRQVASEGAWIEIVTKALADYRSEVVTKSAALR